MCEVEMFVAVIVSGVLACTNTDRKTRSSFNKISRRYRHLYKYKTPKKVITRPRKRKSGLVIVDQQKNAIPL